MTHDEILEIALEAGIVPHELVRNRFVYFAELVAEAEREACAKVCEDSVEYAGDTLAEAIRARGQA